ncbi:MAG: hypothetical protein BEN19_02685 [Epulopiscium sp. Nuni2H_MBin003]|nr:MAG: hypothetical protein BEN19_02685 [Epulopiscium sp. Nuni2H_MBin003]
MIGKSNKGFTLIELVIVVSIIFTVGTVAINIPKIEELRYEAFVKSVYNAMQTGRELAMSSGKYGSRCTIVDDTVKIDNFYGDMIIDIPENVSISINMDSFYLSPTTSGSTAGTMTIYHEKLKQQYRITVAVVSGKITLYKD